MSLDMHTHQVLKSMEVTEFNWNWEMEEEEVKLMTIERMEGDKQ